MDDAVLEPPQIPATSRTPLKEKLVIARDVGKLLLEIAIVALVVYCLFRPEVVRGWLGELGISKMTILGLELTPKTAEDIGQTIQTVTQERDQARDENRLLRRQAAATLAELEKLQDTQPAQSQEAQRVEQLISAIRPAAGAPPPPTSAPSQVQQKIIQGARESVGGDAQWAVVFGADRRPEAGKDEMTWARANGISPARLVLRQNYYRSVAFAENAQNASAILDIARRRRPEAYIVNFATWCPNRETGRDFDTCP